MILYTHPETGFTLTTEDLAELAYAAGEARRARDKDAPKTRAEHAADDVLWALGWCVMSRVPPEQRITA